MGTTSYLTQRFPTDSPAGEDRELDIARTGADVIELRIGSAGDEQPRNQRTAVCLTPDQAREVAAALIRTADYFV